eukprot:scaffold5321_cov267-Pinguiococcus_pyrenoidosus.AAC.4
MDWENQFPKLFLLYYSLLGSFVFAGLHNCAELQGKDFPVVSRKTGCWGDCKVMERIDWNRSPVLWARWMNENEVDGMRRKIERHLCQTGGD